MKVISTRMHGVLDYMTSVALFALPRMLGWGERVTTILTVLAVVTLIYSLLTRYELGAFRALPMRAHLMLDFGSGLLLLALALMLGDEPSGVRTGLAVLGVFEIGAALMTNPEPSAAVAQSGAHTGNRSRGF